MLGMLTPRLVGGIVLVAALAYLFRDPLMDALRGHRGVIIKYGGAAVLSGAVGRQLGQSYGSTPGEWVSTLVDWLVGVLPLV